MANWSGLFNGQYGQNYSGLGVNTSEISNNEKMRLARGFRGRAGRQLGAIIKALTGAAPGASATDTYNQIPANSSLGNPYPNGGYIAAVAVQDVNRVTTSADEATIDALTTLGTGPTYPVDKAGNGGGSKVGSF